MKILIALTILGTAILLASLCFLGAGCASVTQTLRTETRATNGTLTVQETTSRVRTLLDAKNSVDKLRVSNGKTHSVGVAGLDQESSATNTIEALKAIDSILGKVR